MEWSSIAKVKSKDMLKITHMPIKHRKEPRTKGLSTLVSKRWFEF